MRRPAEKALHRRGGGGVAHLGGELYDTPEQPAAEAVGSQSERVVDRVVPSALAVGLMQTGSPVPDLSEERINVEYGARELHASCSRSSLSFVAG